MLCIQELGPFGYTPLIVSLKPSSLSPFVCIKILSFLNQKKKKSFDPGQLELRFSPSSLCKCVIILLQRQVYRE